MHPYQLFTTDQPESFNQAVAAAGDCGLQLTYAKKISTKGSKAMVPGWSIGGGGTHTEVITIQQGTKRQWWVAVINCDQSKGIPYPVDVKSISITDSSKYTIDCATMHNYSVAGYNWAIVVMAIAIIAAAVLAVLYWKKSTIGPSGVVNTGGVGYNELWKGGVTITEEICLGNFANGGPRQ